MFDDTDDVADVGDSLRYHDWFLWVVFGLAESQGDKGDARQNESNHCPEACIRRDS